MEHVELLSKILEMEPAVRFVGIYNENFEKIIDGFQKGTIPHLSREEMQNSVRYDIRRWETYKMFQKQLGDTQYSMVKYDNAILLTFSLNDAEFLRISIEPNTDYKVFIEKVLDLIIKNPILRSK
jgi:hypothetical protein